MTRLFPLQTLLEVMQTRTDEAMRHLARLIADERDAQSKLDLLERYRDEYAARFTQAAQNGLGPREWHNFRQFLSRLDDAIDTQRDVVANQARQTAAGQLLLQQQRRKLKAFDTLSERHRAAENHREMKREQKLQDEFAARSRNDRDDRDA